MRIYISACGIGLGHVGRCIPIAKELRKEGNEILFSTYGKAVNFVKENGFPVIKVKDLIWKEKEGKVSVSLTALFSCEILAKFVSQINQEIKIIKKFKPDIILSDSRFSTLIATKRLKIPTLFLIHQVSVILPEFKFSNIVEKKASLILWKLLKEANLILLPDLPEPYNLTKEYFVTDELKEKMKYIGLISGEIPENLPTKEDLKKQLGVKDKFIFCVLSGPGKFKFKIGEKLKNVLKDLDIDSILIISDPSKKTEKETGKLKIMNWASSNDFYKYLKACDIVISISGLSTVSNIIRFGKPSIIIPIPNQPEHKAICKRLKELGISRIVDNYNEKQIKEAIIETLKDEKIKENCKKISEFSSKFNPTKEILIYLKNIEK